MLEDDFAEYLTIEKRICFIHTIFSRMYPKVQNDDDLIFACKVGIAMAQSVIDDLYYQTKREERGEKK